MLLPTVLLKFAADVAALLVELPEFNHLQKRTGSNDKRRLIIIMIIIIIIIAFKGAIRDFLESPYCTVSNTYDQEAREQPCANHMQHIERLSRATCRVTCHVVRRDSSAVKFDRVEIAII